MPAENDAAGRKVRSGHDLDQIINGERWIIDQRRARVDDLAEIVRRDVGGHADRDAAGSVDQQVWKPRRQHHRFVLVTVVVGLKIDGVFVDIVEQRHRRTRQPALGVPHGRRCIAVDRAKIALAVDQRQAHGKILRHAHERVVDRRVAVRVIFTHHVADHAGRFHVFAVRVMPLLVHRVEDAAMHRLEAVARIGERPRHDHAHGVIEIGALHLLGDGDGPHVRGTAGFSRVLVIGIGHRTGSGTVFRVGFWGWERGQHLGRGRRILIADSARKRHAKAQYAHMIY